MGGFNANYVYAKPHRRRAATFEPEAAVAAAYDERYEAWREIYRRMLDISEEGLLNPLWRAAGA